MGCTSSKMIAGSRGTFSDAQQQQQHQSQPELFSDRMSNLNIQEGYTAVTPSGIGAEVQHHPASNPSGPCVCGHKTDISEQVLLMDNVAKLFHALNEQHRAIVMNSILRSNTQNDQRFESALTAVFQVVLQYCELLTAIIGDDKVVSDPVQALVMVTNTTISVMIAKTIIDIFDFVLYKSEENLWPSVHIASPKLTPSCQNEDSNTRSSPNINHAYDSDRLLKMYEQMETMDFHVVHLGAICRRLQEIGCQMSGEVAPRVTEVDGVGLSNKSEPQICVSQDEAIDRALTAAASTRQEISRLRGMINSSDPIPQ